MHSQLLEGFKCESKQKTTEEEGVGARSLAHNTWRGRGVCWSFGMGLGRVDKFQLLTQGCTKSTQGGQCIVGAPLVLGRTIDNMDTQDSPWPRLGGSHHFLFYSILCDYRAHIQMVFCPGIAKWESRNRPSWDSHDFGAHEFTSKPSIEMNSEAKLQLLLRAFQRYVAHHLQISKLGRFLTFSGRESNCQFDSQPFFWP